MNEFFPGTFQKYSAWYWKKARAFDIAMCSFMSFDASFRKQICKNIEELTVLMSSIVGLLALTEACKSQCIQHAIVTKHY